MGTLLYAASMSAFQKLRASARANHEEAMQRSEQSPYLVLSSTSHAPQLRGAFHQQVQAVIAQFLAGCCVGIDPGPAQIIYGPDFLLAF